jgi:hypothetical protein
MGRYPLTLTLSPQLSGGEGKIGNFSEIIYNKINTISFLQ